jgi:putative endonuclease
VPVKHRTRAQAGGEVWSIYMVRCRDGALYTGIALDVRRRLAQHAGSDGRGAKALRGRGPLRLVLKRRLGSRSLALAVEFRIKRLTKTKKTALLSRRSHLDRLIAAARQR